MGQPLKYLFILFDSEEGFSILEALSGRLSLSYTTPLPANGTRAQTVTPGALKSKGWLILQHFILTKGEDLLSHFVHQKTKARHCDSKTKHPPSILLASEGGFFHTRWRESTGRIKMYESGQKEMYIAEETLLCKGLLQNLPPSEVFPGHLCFFPIMWVMVLHPPVSIFYFSGFASTLDNEEPVPKCLTSKKSGRRERFLSEMFQKGIYIRMFC